MKRIIFGGSGFIGQALVHNCLQKQIAVCVVGRDKEKLQSIFPSQVEILSWNEFDQDPYRHLQESDVILNLCGENIGQERWSSQRKKQIIESRTVTTRKIAHYCATLGEKSPRLFNASAIGIYGLSKHAPASQITFDENFDVGANPGTDFLSEVALAWEKALQPAIAANVPVTKLRFGVVLAKQGGALKQMLPAYYLGLGGIIGNGQQIMSWITLADLCRAIDFLIDQTDTTGAFNLVAPHPVTQQQFARALCQTLHRPCFFKMPAWFLKLIFGQMADELLLHGQRVIPEKLVKRGFKFEFPDIKSALNHVIL